MIDHSGSIIRIYSFFSVASELGEHLHSYVGHEPSGRLFNEICLDPNGKPHNPMINSGAIIVTSLLHKGQPMADRYDFVGAFYITSLYLIID